MPDDEVTLGVVIEEEETGWVILHISGKNVGWQELYEPMSLYDDFGWVAISQNHLEVISESG